jgi:hypothetical protein
LAVRFRTVRQRRIRVHHIPLRVRDDREPPPLEERDGNTIIRKSEQVKLISVIRNVISRHRRAVQARIGKSPLVVFLRIQALCPGLTAEKRGYTLY